MSNSGWPEQMLKSSPPEGRKRENTKYEKEE
jgi:hypothetical protein